MLGDAHKNVQACVFTVGLLVNSSEKNWPLGKYDWRPLDGFSTLDLLSNSASATHLLPEPGMQPVGSTGCTSEVKLISKCCTIKCNTVFFFLANIKLGVDV